MKVLKKLVIAIICAAFMMSSAATALADETTAASQPSETASETKATFDISKLSFDTMYGNQIGDFLNHEYVFDGQKIPVTESNYYFLLTFLQLSQYAAYGYFPATGEGYLDLAASYGDNGETYAQYFVKQAEDYLHSTYILANRARAAGVKLSDEDKKAIDDEINERIEQQANPAGVPLDTILKLYFGPDCDEKAYRAILENASLAGKYQEKFAADYKIPEDQMMVPNIAYALFYAPGASASAEDKKKAETGANEMLAKCKTAADLPKLAEEAQKAGTVYDQSTISVRKGETVSTFEEWAYKAERKEGDVGVIFAEEYGYFCVGYLGKVKLAQEELQDVANEALNKEIEAEMKENKHGFKTDKAFPTAKPAPTAVPQETGENGNTPGIETAPSALPTDNGDTATANGMSKVLIVIFLVIGGIAIIAVIVILVMNYMDSDKKDDSKKSSSKKSSASKKSTKKPVVEEDDEEDEDEDYEEDEEDEEYEDDEEEGEDPYSGISEDEESEEEQSEEESEEKPADKKGGNDKDKNNKKRR